MFHMQTFILLVSIFFLIISYKYKDNGDDVDNDQLVTRNEIKLCVKEEAFLKEPGTVFNAHSIYTYKNTRYSDTKYNVYSSIVF